MQLTSPETLGLSLAVTFGALALLTGFFGLVALYRHRPGQTQTTPSVWPDREPAGWRKPAEKPAEPAPDKEPPTA